MCTEQNYVGKGDYANDSEQPASTDQSNLSMATKQSSARKTIEVNCQVYEAQTKQLALVKDFIDTHGAASPIEAINDLLFRWLDLPTTDSRLDANRDQLFRTQQLINFLAELAESADKVDRFTNQMKE